MRDVLATRPYPRRLSIVVPMYNEEGIVPFFRTAALSSVNELACETEIVFVNDRSRDSTIEQLDRWALAGETWFKPGTAWLFYRLMRFLVYKDLPVDAGDFRLISRECLDGLSRMRETHRFLRGMTAWVGFPQIAVRYRRGPRAAGETKYPLRRLLSLAWNAATSFSIVPLRLSFGFALIVGAVSVEEGIRALMAWAFGWYTVSGWTSVTVLLSGIGAALLFSVGVLGEYVGKLHEQSKDRPLYIAARTWNLGDATSSRVLDKETSAR